MKCSISSSQYSKVFYYPNVVSGNIVFLTFIYTITIFAANMEAIRMANDDLDAFNNIPSSFIHHRTYPISCADQRCSEDEYPFQELEVPLDQNS